MSSSSFNVRDLWDHPTPYMKERAKQFENRDWFAQHMDEMWNQYKGKVVAVYDKEIKAVGASAEEVRGKLGEKYPREGVMMVLVPEEPVFRVPYPSDMFGPK